MAKKRIKKKLEKKKKISLLLSDSSVSKKETKRLKGRELDVVYKQVNQRVKNRERARAISAEAKKWGLSPTKFNSWKKLLPEIERIKKEIVKEEKREEQRRKRAERNKGKTLYVFWTDTQGHSLEEWDRQRDQVEHIYNVHGEEGLRSHIKNTMHDRLGIPTGACNDPQIVDDKSQIELIDYYYSDGWREVYSGKCRYWLPILKLIATMMTALYKPEDKLQFVLDLSAEVDYFSNEFAERIHGLIY
ncbi:hypothetical protein [Bacillus thuringiensis]|uniref:hypothetical protein n=1 Tax=Bacillus thuringiensis TaxID=1428 RepID=UPI0020CE43E7|nr:hypothetical protein [Bacillus thuringiensis]